MIFELAQDFHDAAAVFPREHPKHRMLELLEEAIRRDIHFILRHPTTLFQCMWNTCWWYDCPEAAVLRRTTSDPVGRRDHLGPVPVAHRLHLLLESWRDERERARPGCYWLISLRPPIPRLNNGLFLALRGHGHYVNAVSFFPDSARLATASHDRTVRIWDLASGAEILQLRGHTGAIWGVAVSPDGESVASASEDGTVRTWCPISGVERSCLQDRDAHFVCVAYSRDGNLLAAGTLEGYVSVWSVQNSENVRRLQHAQPESPTPNRMNLGSTVRWVDFSWDGHRLASAGFDKAVRIWDVSTGALLCNLGGHTDWVFSARFSADGERLVSAGQDHTIRVWDIPRQMEVCCLDGHTDNVCNALFRDGGRQVVSCSTDGSVRLWEVGKCAALQCWRGHDGLVLGLALSPDEHWIASTGRDRMVLVWDATCGSSDTPQDETLGGIHEVNNLKFLDSKDRIEISYLSRSPFLQPRALIVEVPMLAAKPLATAKANASEVPSTGNWDVCVVSGETAITSRQTEKTAAWYPVALWRHASHPLGRIWTGTDQRMISVIRLEGGSRQ